MSMAQHWCAAAAGLVPFRELRKRHPAGLARTCERELQAPLSGRSAPYVRIWIRQLHAACFPTGRTEPSCMLRAWRVRLQCISTTHYSGPSCCVFPNSANKPLCVARDYGDHTNININDVLGNYSLGLIDSLDTLAIMGNRSEFAKAVALVIKTVPSFDLNSTVQVFESNIRVLGGLLSAHAIAVHPAFDMGTVLLPAGPSHFAQHQSGSTLQSVSTSQCLLRLQA
eukprot:SAG31_NODE_1156_length_9616_cov_26.963014_3_plen_226_part_00